MCVCVCVLHIEVSACVFTEGKMRVLFNVCAEIWKTGCELSIHNVCVSVQGGLLEHVKETRCS